MTSGEGYLWPVLTDVWAQPFISCHNTQNECLQQQRKYIYVNNRVLRYIVTDRADRPHTGPTELLEGLPNVLPEKAHQKPKCIDCINAHG
ncbi:hypothetical protein J6590_065371 [Homalodisca vitripennis]|nr:hypothetical protein J6590_065371 [Homalodisca vitripennis]